MKLPQTTVGFGLAFLLCPFFLVQAFSPTVHAVPQSYDPLIIRGDIAVEHVYLGDLAGDPHMYEFTVGEPSSLALTLRQEDSDTPLPLGLIVVSVEENNRGVVEVGRLLGDTTLWKSERESTYGLTLLKSQPFTTDLKPGTYRIEVSTPENKGKYLLKVGSIPDERGYFETLGDIRAVQTFFGASVFSMIFSQHVYLPVGVLLMGLVLFLTWRKRRVITNHA